MGKLFLSWIIFDKMVRSRAYGILIYRAKRVLLIGRKRVRRFSPSHMKISLSCFVLANAFLGSFSSPRAILQSG